MKDSKNSWEQRSWEYAVAEHTRLKEWLAKYNTPMLISYAKERMEKLEKEYPQLIKM